jgi:hypothetical protein
MTSRARIDVGSGRLWRDIEDDDACVSCSPCALSNDVSQEVVAMEVRERSTVCSSPFSSVLCCFLNVEDEECGVEYVVRVVTVEVEKVGSTGSG